MNTNVVYINEAIDNSFATYEKYKDHKDTLEFNTFLCTIARQLVLIYGQEVELDYQTRNPATLIYTITKYGTSIEEANNFMLLVDKFYKMEQKQANKAIRKKNKYFNAIQKYLIDLLVTKNAKEPCDEQTIKEFHRLLFTVHSRSFYRRSTALVLAYDPYEIEDYYKAQNLGGKK